MNKLNLYEWMCVEYDDIYSTPESAKIGLKSLLDSEFHRGDCTKENFTCSLCLVETLLNEYYLHIQR